VDFVDPFVGEVCEDGFPRRGAVKRSVEAGIQIQIDRVLRAFTEQVDTTPVLFDNEAEHDTTDSESELGESRRTVLKTIGAGATGWSIAMAGCSAFGGGNGDGNSNGDGSSNDNGGAVDEEERTENPDGEPVRKLNYLTLTQDLNPPRYGWSQMHANNLRELGFQIELEAAGVGSYIDRAWVARDFDFYVVRWADGWDPDRQLTDMFSSGALDEGGGNICGYKNSDYDELNNQQQSTPQFEERREIIYEAQKMLMEDQPITPNWAEERAMELWGDRFTNEVVQPENGLSAVWNFANIEATDPEHEPLVYTQPEFLVTLNPITPQRGRVERETNQITYDRLMFPDENGEGPVPWLAEEVNEPDSTTYEVRLREGHTWHDGEPVTAEDVKFTFEYGIEHSPAIASVNEPLESIEIETDLDLTFNLSSPSAPYKMRAFAGRDASILPQHIWKDIPESVDVGSVAEWNNEEAIGSGLFRVDEFIQDEELRLSAHENHWNAPNVDEAIRVQAADERTASRMLEDGTADKLNYGLLLDDIPRFEEMDQVNLHGSVMTSFHYCNYNLRRKPFTNTNLRLAMAHAVPKQESLEVQLAGRGVITHAPFSPVLERFINPDNPQFNLDLERSRELLSEAGFEWDQDGRIHMPPGGVQSPEESDISASDTPWK